MGGNRGYKPSYLPRVKPAKFEPNLAATAMKKTDAMPVFASRPMRCLSSLRVSVFKFESEPNLAAIAMKQTDATPVFASDDETDRCDAFASDEIDRCDACLRLSFR